SIKEQLRCLPQQGISYGWLRYLLTKTEIAAFLRAQPSSEVCFNHLGQFDSLLHTSTFQLATESTNPSRSPLNHRSHQLEINSMIIGAQLRVDWTYSENLHRLSTIESLANEFLQCLQKLITHCLAPEAFGYTPTDFPLAKLNNVKLEQLLSNIVPQQGNATTNWKNIADIYPLSSVQQGMLFHTLYAPDSGVYCQQFSCTMTGNVNVEAFTAAWQLVVARHVVLRTGFTSAESDLQLQVVYRQVELPLRVHSWVELSIDEQQQQIQTFLSSDATRSFPLTLAPLMRLNLIQMSADVYQFVWSYHHILIDGWSLPLVFKEVLGYYEALCEGQELQLPSSRDYREYIAWLHKQKLEIACQFWRQKLQGVTAPTPLVLERAHHLSAHDISYSEQIQQLSVSTTSALVSFARQHQLTLNTLVQAAWAILLARYSGETDVVFGVIVSGRSPAIVGVESIVGLFINTLPMRVSVLDEDTVLPLLKQIHLQQVEISQYEYTPLVEIQRISDVPRGLPLFESIVAFENYPVDAALEQHSQKLHISDVRAIERNNYPLTLIIQPGEQLSLRFISDRQRFENATIARMASHFQTLLSGMIANPHGQLSDLPLLNATEQHQILVGWNQTEADYPQNRCLHSLFEEQVQKTPLSVAVVFEEQQLTYTELNTLANQLADYLRSLGVGPEVLVGVCVERSISMVVGLLGILKAGGAYVPLDPTYPSTRLGFMLSDSQVSVLLTQEKLLEKLPVHQANVVVLDRDWQAAQYSQSNCVSSVTASNLAYVIYTSGSTGNPKGVAIEHHSPVTLVQWAKSVFSPQQCAGVLASTSICFDLSVFELFVPLSCGGMTILAQNALHLPNLPKGNQVSLINTVPSAIAELERIKGIPASVQTVNLAGEALPNQLVQKIYELNTIQQVYNLYGPSEDTTYSTFALVEKGATQPPSIGRPLANTLIYILDAQLQPVPVGVAGELHIGGDGLARGYLRRPELTAEKFIPNPFALDKPDSRLYKTGDLARYSIDGNIEYLGRIDHQVKVRGFRIELGEIEAVLSSHPNVRQTVVTATREVVGATRLVTYLVAKAQPAPTISELRAFLSQQLPEYMIPSAFVGLDSLPLTPNGKLDRLALPDPELAQPSLEKTFVAPHTPTEEVLADIWTQVLRLERVGIKDNFYDLGGHSLIATQLVFRIRNTFKVELPLHVLLETPTVAEMAEAIDHVGQAKLTPSATRSVTELNAEAVLDDTIYPTNIPVEYVTPAHIFLTGATGFLGAFLLYELLQQTDADIYCLVRSSNVESGLKKIQANLESYLLWNECFRSRIILVLGDLSQPLFGLGNQQFELLASRIDVIYHNGALVNFVEPYSKLKAANVLGTQEVLRLATQIKLKPVHYISTISVFSWEEDVPKEHIFRENDSLDHGSLAGGYKQSKWVAEKLVTIARTRGLPVCIYRPGRVSGHSQTGICTTNDLISRMIKGCIQLGSVPDLDIMVEMVPADYASKSIVHISRQKKSLGETFHIINPVPAPWSVVFTWLRSFGYSLEQISYKNWRADLLKSVEQSSENILYGLIHLFTEVSEIDNEMKEQTSNSVTIKFDCQNTLNSLAETSINCPPVSAELLSTYISYYIRSGFLENIQ
ncbi:MAG: amino acid adenylation domain-containing protein, partial [Rhizonema sp. NSF051]|nr:amino acid adenylation domain-containing protein [Rhizonema sp. NSF051]